MCSADSPGHSTSKADAVVIFDLDGTILSVNSFPYWVRYMLTGHFSGLSMTERMALSLRTGQILAGRKVMGQSHERTKRQLQALWAKALQKDATQAATYRLNGILQDYVRPNMRGVIAAVARQRVDAVLATSAAGEYAQGLARTLGFTHIQTTPLCTQFRSWARSLANNSENRGERKRDRVLALLAAQGWIQRQRIFLTDHAEDLPLIRECQHTLWFGRDEDATSIQASVPQAEITACRNVPDAAVMRLTGSL